MSFWQTARFRIDLSFPKVMGIVNVTPDSFSDGGSCADAASAIAHCEQLLAEGADMLDIGGESTRPGAAPVSVDEELSRVLPVIEAAVTLGCPVSVDTRKADVMAAALDRGADIVNDAGALRAPGALAAIGTHSDCGICLMHMKGEPQSMQSKPHYGDVLEEVVGFLRERVQALQAQGIEPDRMVVDPGIGFGKSPDHNLELLRRQPELLAVGRPLLVGWSRKSTLGLITGRDVDQRLVASVAAVLACVHAGARVVRVHDVAATVDALKVWTAAGLVR